MGGVNPSEHGNRLLCSTMTRRSYTLPAMSGRGMMNAVLSHGMRAYYMPMACGVALAVSAFMPWMMMGGEGRGGVPSVAGLWVLALGLLAVLLASLSVITRRNSRHPLLLVGLAAFAILLIGEKFLERTAADQLWARVQAQAIVSGGPVVEVPPPMMGIGAYVGLTASSLITLFGLTIVVKQVSQPFAEPEDDDA